MTAEDGFGSLGADGPITSRVTREKVETGRNNYLKRHSGSLFRQGADEQEILRQLLVINAEDCREPLDSKEVAEIARKMVKKGR